MKPGGIVTFPLLLVTLLPADGIIKAIHAGRPIFGNIKSD